MTTHAEGTFTLRGWDENALEESPTKLSSATLTQTWTGDAEGDAVVRTLMHYAPDGTAAIAGTLRLTGPVDGPRGGFVATRTGDIDGEHVNVDLTVAPGSGTGELEGVGGTCSFHAPKGPEGTWVVDLT